MVGRDEFPVGCRVVIVDPGDPHYGEWGTVTEAEQPAVLTGRPMVVVALDEHPDYVHDEGFYVQQIEALGSLGRTRRTVAA